jgi:branched-subunit amino acid transport protein
MVQVVSRLSLATEVRIRALVSPRVICGLQSGLGQALLRVLRFSPISIITLWLSILIYHLKDEQKARWWP